MPSANCQLIVIADDITGAAEIAGIGWRFGFRVNLTMYRGEETVACPEQCDMLVFATDTRSMTEAEAVEETTRIANAIKNMGCTHIFKKTDSILRGHIAIELRTLMEITGITRALLLPQNPSRGRTIEKGMYYINKTPLNKTIFANDPEFPVTTADVSKLLFHKHSGKILILQRSMGERGLYVAEAATVEDVKRRAGEIKEGILAAGGADFFTAWLIARGYNVDAHAPFEGIQSKHALIILGSTNSKPPADFSYIQRQDIVQYNIPAVLFYREAPEQWIEKLKRAYAKHDSLILYINHPPRKGRDIALRLREEMGKAVAALLSERIPQELIIEGGATAFSILKRTAWNIFSIECEVTHGVIRMAPAKNPGITITLKPGSYPWGNLFDTA
ncbi:MAG: four-carbon acid sugar kinase family protein [Mediterranea sp.]|jgi:uncharacterized protein YgbK (DUF1537 family)|nr:four-carbon acid sugar kinase family protein [Mediterranea sp.]